MGPRRGGAASSGAVSGGASPVFRTPSQPGAPATRSFWGVPPGGLRVRTQLLLALAACLTLAGCSSSGQNVARSDPSAGLPPSDSVHPMLPYGTQGPVVASRISPDLAPPLGQCRVWLPGLAPADQPAPTICSRAKAHVPLGALLVQTTQPGIIEVTTYDGQFRDLIVMVARYDATTGELVEDGSTGTGD